MYIPIKQTSSLFYYLELNHLSVRVLSAGVDECMVVTMKYSGNRMAVCLISNAVALPNEAVITGTKGSVRVGGGFTT